MHQVYDDRLRPFQVSLPALNARLLVVFTVGLDHRDQWFDLDSIEVFVKTVQDYVQQLE